MICAVPETRIGLEISAPATGIWTTTDRERLGPTDRVDAGLTGEPVSVAVTCLATLVHADTLRTSASTMIDRRTARDDATPT